MSQFEYRQYYERNRPHIHPPDRVLFVTFRLAGSVPKKVLEEYKVEKAWLDGEIKRINGRASDKAADVEQKERLNIFHREWFSRFETIMDASKDGPMWLGQAEIRKIVADKLIEGDEERYRLDAFCIMSNHVHVVFKPSISESNLTHGVRDGRVHFATNQKTTAQIMQGIKGSTARRANISLGRKGSFWESESYDHFVRDDAEFYRVVRYTLKNPVKARLVSDWRDWPGTYLAPRLSAAFEYTLFRTTN